MSKISAGLLLETSMSFPRLIMGACLIGTLLAGCVSTPEGVATHNRKRLMNLSLGMSPAEMLAVMGDAPTNIAGASNPMGKEMFRSQGRAIEIYYYYSIVRRKDGAISNDELTPVIFVDGKLEGVGDAYFNEAVTKYDIEIRNR